MRPRHAAAGTATPPGPTTSTTRCARSADRRARRLLRRLRPVAQLAKAFHRPYVVRRRLLAFRRRRFGAPADDVPPERFVVFSQNHDQVGNRAFGDRLPAAARPLAAFCTLLVAVTSRCCSWARSTASSAPFQFFSDHIDPEIARATREGRRARVRRLRPASRRAIPDPAGPGDVRALEARRASATPELAATVPPSCCAPRGGCCPARPDVIEFDEDAALAARAPRPVRAGLQLRRSESRRAAVHGRVRS